jgi:hypothetical protein
MIVHIVPPREPQLWVGSFYGNSWTTDWVKFPYIHMRINGFPKGTFMMGHMGYKKEIEELFLERGIIMLFAYRDLRDVVVSQTYHIENEDVEIAKHIGKKEGIYDGMSHEEVMLSTITGIDRFPGVFDRWKLFAPWLDIPWVHKVRYEDMVLDTEKTMQKILQYILQNEFDDAPFIPILYDDVVKATVEKGIQNRHDTKKHASFRKGIVGNWKDEFTPKVKSAFKEHDTEGWLERLGYAQGNDW